MGCVMPKWQCGQCSLINDEEWDECDACGGAPTNDRVMISLVSPSSSTRRRTRGPLPAPDAVQEALAAPVPLVRRGWHEAYWNEYWNGAGTNHIGMN